MGFSTRIASQLEKIRHIQREYRYAIKYCGIPSDLDGYDADVSDGDISDHQDEDMTDNNNDNICDHVDKGDDSLSDGPDVSGSRHWMSDTESVDESRTSDSASVGSVSDCGDNDIDVEENWMYSNYLEKIREEYMTLASIDSREYEPLRHERREIRLLFIMPREFRLVTGRALVSCFTVIQQLDNSQPFRGLSYVWGNEKDSLPIILNNRVIHVTRNLATALKHIEHDRVRWGVRVFWIDAICINQRNNTEKSHQVQMMGDIYRRATRVFSWLGRPTRLTHSLLNWIPKLIQDFELAYKSKHPDEDFYWDVHNFNYLPADRRVTFAIYLHRTFIAENGRYKHIRLLIEFARICVNQYWKRVWILQEIANCNSVRIFLGCHFIALRYIYQFSSIIESARQHIMELRSRNKPLANGQSPLRLYPRKFEFIWKDAFWTPQPKKAIGLVAGLARGERLSVLLSKTIAQLSGGLHSEQSNFQSSRPEDMVFALLGLADDVLDLELVADYSKGVRDVYIETASSILRRCEYLQVLSYCQFPRRIGGLPSWVPDWSMILPAWPLCDLSDHLDLTIPGVFVDTIQSALQYQYQHEDPSGAGMVEQMHRFITSALDFIHQQTESGTSERYADGERAFEVLYHVSLSPASMSSAKHDSEFQQFVQDCQALARWKYTSDCPDHIYSLIHRLENGWLWGRRVFATARGSIGIGPEYVQEGDVVVILHGGKIPFLLRPVKDGRQGHYELMGETYMYGMMEGQFMRTNPPTQEFTLV
ncbi:heterokaryon incompatibility protein-domain-containing protein [Pseudoneurospora amorphoporcata]|uniref:Heterokaryon incompatibility protein-domain-containing protein n=1 Tax=Pseudoneurospora amorphoporcata TaxID=241081 RepID=A0AAN6SD06_9PEZI|nr:heterokaryon incompatibility protein-domain-containing protein [Pseudoneurospora amorphoporcata]